MNYMKKTICSFLVVILCGFTTSEAVAQYVADGKNMVKFNALTLIGGKFSFEYERLLTNRVTVGTAVSFRPDKALPFRDRVRDWVDDENLHVVLDGMRSSNFSVTPEVRFYTSSRGPFRGFYIAPYVKYASYQANMPFDFDVEMEYEGQTVYDRTERIPLDGSFQSFTGGVSVGFNFKLSEQLHLDWRLIGPGYGSAKGDITGTMALNADEQAALREALRELQFELEDLPIPLSTDYEVSNTGARINLLNSPWASIRTGLSISYRF